MAFCVNCKLCFRDKWVLERHLSRIKPCVKKVENVPTLITPDLAPNPSLPASDPSLLAPNPSLLAPNPSLPTKINKCEYCLNNFSRRYTLNKHQTICKFRDDPIRLLEIEKKVEIILPESKTECRFCNYNFTNITNLDRHFKICKEREIYHKNLKETVNQTIETINNSGSIGTLNNGTINNINNINKGTINNITINNFGQESLEHIQIDKTIDLLRKIRKDYDTDDVFLSAGELIISFDNYIRKIPENRNLTLTDPKGIYANVKTAEGWEMISVENVLSKGFKKSAGILYGKKESINENNERVFQNKINKEIFVEISEFAKRGFEHYKYGDTKLRKVKTSYKVNKLNETRKQNVIDF